VTLVIHDFLNFVYFVCLVLCCIIQVPSIVRSLGTEDILLMRHQTQFLWNTYFSSIDKIVATTLEVPVSNKITVDYNKNKASPKYKYKYNSYFYSAPYSLTDDALQKSANTCFTAVGRLK